MKITAYTEVNEFDVLNTVEFIKLLSSSFNNARLEIVTNDISNILEYENVFRSLKKSHLLLDTKIKLSSDPSVEAKAWADFSTDNYLSLFSGNIELECDYSQLNHITFKNRITHVRYINCSFVTNYTLLSLKSAEIIRSSAKYVHFISMNNFVSLNMTAETLHTENVNTVDINLGDINLFTYNSNARGNISYMGSNMKKCNINCTYGVYLSVFSASDNILTRSIDEMLKNNDDILMCESSLKNMYGKKISMDIMTVSVYKKCKDSSSEIITVFVNQHNLQNYFN